MTHRLFPSGTHKITIFFGGKKPCLNNNKENITEVQFWRWEGEQVEGGCVGLCRRAINSILHGPIWNRSCRARLEIHAGYLSGFITSHLGDFGKPQIGNSIPVFLLCTFWHSQIYCPWTQRFYLAIVLIAKHGNQVEWQIQISQHKKWYMVWCGLRDSFKPCS